MHGHLYFPVPYALYEEFDRSEDFDFARSYLLLSSLRFTRN